ncbi:MAG: peptidoglycan DD-metalloendopeptidase family protein [Pseudomonadota bacterium]
MRWALALVLAALPAAADPVADAERASAALREARLSLDAATGRRDRVAALTETIKAYEAGLAAFRAAIRDGRSEERVLETALAAREDQFARILAVLTSLRAEPETFLLLHPSGPLETARAGMVAGDVAPALQAEVAEIKGLLENLAALTAIREKAQGTLADGLAGVEAARTELTAAMAARKELPQRVATDAAAMAALLDAADTLDGFAAGLSSQGISPGNAFEASLGELPLPVSGRRLRAAGERDAAGIDRPGWVIATQPRALVTAISPSTIRYAGPLLDYGNVIIIEPETGYLLVLAGLGDLLVGPGDVVNKGAALGLMPGLGNSFEGNLGKNSQGSGQAASETLYIEAREANTPVDPAGWFRIAEVE